MPLARQIQNQGIQLENQRQQDFNRIGLLAPGARGIYGRLFLVQLLKFNVKNNGMFTGKTAIQTTFKRVVLNLV